MSKIIDSEKQLAVHSLAKNKMERDERKGLFAFSAVIDQSDYH